MRRAAPQNAIKYRYAILLAQRPVGAPAERAEMHGDE
jgi:hypothetical protein